MMKNNNFGLIAKHFFKPAKTVLITGERGAGKTDFALLCAFYMVKYQGWQCITNIFLEKKYSDFYYISNARELLLKLAETDNNKTILILDEAGLIASSKRAMSKDSINLELFIDLIRKFGICLVFITPNFKNVVPKIRINYDIWFNKINWNQAFAYLNNSRDNGTLLNDIPKAPIDFDTLNLAGFDFNIDIHKFAFALSQYHSREYKNMILMLLSEVKEDLPEIDNNVLVTELLIRAKNNNEPFPARFVFKTGLSGCSQKHIYKLYNKLVGDDN